MPARRDMDPGNSEPLAELVRDLIRNDPRSVTRIAIDANISQSSLARFVLNQRDLQSKMFCRLLATLHQKLVSMEDEGFIKEDHDTG